MGIRAPTPNDLVRDCQYLLEVRRVRAWRNNVGAATIKGTFVRFGGAGSPDIIGILPGGRFLGVECKTGSGRLSAAQRAWHAAARDAGALVLVVRSIDELDDALREVMA